MSRRHGLDGLARWAERDDWAELFDEVFDRHFGDVLDEHDLDFEELDDLIGEAQADMLWAWCFEDFATVTRQADGLTVVDDYLKRRGWKESVTNRRYLEALKTSVVGFWEVIEAAPRRSVTLVERVAEAEPVVIDDAALAEALHVGDCFAGRVVEISGRMRVAGATLVFPEPMPDLLLGGLAALIESFRDEMRGAGAEPADRADSAVAGMFMRTLAPAFFASAWLDSVLSDLLGEEAAAAVNLDGEPVLFHTLRYPLAQRSASLRLRARLDEAAWLMRDGPDRWLWMLAARPAPEDVPAVFAERAADGREVAGRLELKAGTLTLTVNSAARAVRAQGLVRGDAGDLLAEPETSSQTLEQHIEANPAAAAHLAGWTAPSSEAD